MTEKNMTKLEKFSLVVKKISTIVSVLFVLGFMAAGWYNADMLKFVGGGTAGAMVFMGLGGFMLNSIYDNRWKYAGVSGIIFVAWFIMVA